MTRFVLCSGLVVLLGSAPVFAQNKVLVVKCATISGNWDPGFPFTNVKAPDTYVKARVFSVNQAGQLQQVDYGETKPVANSNTPVWEKDVASVQIGYRVSLEVLDKDPFNSVNRDDRIGIHEFTFTADMFRKGTVVVYFGSAKQHELRLGIR